MVAPKVTLSKNPAGLAKGAGYRAALEIMRETGQPFTATELAHLVLAGAEPHLMVTDPALRRRLRPELARSALAGLPDEELR